jgi:adenylate kinase
MPPIERKKLDLAPLKAAKTPIFFICGGPGSGKGTQCEKLVAKYNLTHLSSGDLLRAEVASGSPRGASLSALMEAGQLVPLEVVLDLIAEAMLNAVKKGSKGFLIDGYPREVPQGIQFENEIMPCALCVYYNVPEQVLIERLLHRGKTSGRVDDNLETIKKRLHTFYNQTQPVVDHYKAQSKLIEIDARGGKDEVFAETVKVFDKHIK